MKQFIVFFLMISTLSCAQDKTDIKVETQWQREINTNFKDASKSPLTAKGLKKFKGLDFFSFDSSYVVTAKLKLTPDSKPFKMKTTTDRRPLYRIFGIATFELNGKTHQLNVYQNLGLLNKKGYEDYLSIPFYDDTNGETTYGGGRYVEARIPEGDHLVINFNQAYNPYCAYSDRYSCTLVPRVNYLETAVEAGVKAYKKP
ncbi:DUF1684 domain-containing protein [Ichthyenterobacterium sp. W332]|uniref:DUF1684 domain-containing protein n=1 Tax=Microcosmobacter mediterraneus TaxID=3075607 RepID=A0ABU2YG16_9FLAO|nr:DUF1684 domain-containing protein [Ichthyenterobacterium sp. W332]MDT0557120.1 DUF1684 domain-containing protein [Ichthyenterobacterium sp. W332]